MCQINQIITGCGSLGPLKNNYQKNIAHNGRVFAFGLEFEKQNFNITTNGK